MKKSILTLLLDKKINYPSTWSLSDDLETDVVIGNEIDGALVGGNTADVSATLDSKPAFHLNGTDQYVVIDMLNIQPTKNKLTPSEIGSLWTKYESNPVLSELPNSVKYGQLCKNPAGGWYFFGSLAQTDVYRWESTDLITWTNKTLVLASGGESAWDYKIGLVTVFQKPDESWIMLYRGFNTSFQIGLATSSDGTTFTRKDNGGVDDGLFPQFDNHYDPVGVILVGTRYFVYVNGDPNHGVQSVYYSDDDCNTFTAYSGNPIFENYSTVDNSGTFCSGVFKYGDHYYLLATKDFVGTGSDLYDHAIALYRCVDPYFDKSNREFLGYVIVNDETYDAAYLDTPSVPTLDVYRNTFSEDFGDTLYMLYTGGNVQGLAYTTFTELSTRRQMKELQSIVNKDEKTYSLKLQFDSLSEGMPIISLGTSPGDSSAVMFAAVRVSGGKYFVALLLGGGYRLTSLELAINTLYHLVIVDTVANKKVYINNNLVGTFTQSNTAVDLNYLYLGVGYPGTLFFDGYIQDFRIYPKALNTTEINRLYLNGKI